jgi:hypothetical protein
MRKRKLIVVLAGLTVVVAAGVVVLWPRPDRITRENYDRIRVGMNRAEVYTVLGPPRDYSTGPTLYVLDALYPHDIMQDPYPDQEVSWWGDTGEIDVYFSPSGVTAATFARALKGRKNVVGDLLWRAKRQWRRWFP